MNTWKTQSLDEADDIGNESKFIQDNLNNDNNNFENKINAAPQTDCEMNPLNSTTSPTMSTTTTTTSDNVDDDHKQSNETTTTTTTPPSSSSPPIKTTFNTSTMSSKVTVALHNTKHFVVFTMLSQIKVFSFLILCFQ